MEQKDKDLLLADLCARLPYGVKFKWCDNFHVDDYYTLVGINEGQITGRDVNQDDCLFFWGKDKIKPYLRPLSSITEEEYDEMFQQLYSAQEEFFRNCSNTDTIGKTIAYDWVRYDWLNKNMFDYRGLIPKDLALSTDEFNPYIDNSI